MGRFDIPNTIDYILAQTQQTSLFHIGHSQGKLFYKYSRLCKFEIFILNQKKGQKEL